MQSSKDLDHDPDTVELFKHSEFEKKNYIKKYLAYFSRTCQIKDFSTHKNRNQKLGANLSERIILQIEEKKVLKK